jgi:hypothetical protein
VSTDGIRCFKVGNQQIWPILLAINELPPNIRFKQENLLFAGAWAGTNKPDFVAFFSELAKRFVTLSSTGLAIKKPNGEEAMIKAYIITATADNPAKDGLLNKVGYNGFDGCANCHQHGTLAVNKNGVPTIVCYPFDEDAYHDLRTDETIREDAEKADETGEKQRGISGISVLMFFSGLCMWLPLDYMHSVDLGPMKKQLLLWFDKKYATQPFSMHGNVHIFDRLMMEIKPTVNCSRPPRPFTNNINNWKAAEFRGFLLYWGPYA